MVQAMNDLAICEHYIYILVHVKQRKMGHQKVCKQGKDDIKVKVNIQSFIPTSFYTTVAMFLRFRDTVDT